MTADAPPPPPPSPSPSDDDDVEFTDAMHYRASILTDLPRMPDRLVPRDEREGMLRGKGTAEMEGPLRDLLKSLERPKNSERTKSDAFRDGEVEAVRKILDRIDETAKKRMREGFREVNFTLGVLNSFLMAFVFGAYPQHFWLLYLVEGCYLIPRKFMYMVKAKPLNEAFYYFDLCWFLNFLLISGLMVLLAQSLDLVDIPYWLRKEVYVAFAGSCCGPLMGATSVLPFVAFLFHDVRTMTGLFIHLYPPMLAYIFLWRSDLVRDAWPGVFAMDYLDQVRFFPESGPVFLPFTGLGTIAGNSLAVYSGWFVSYTGWMILIGLDMPRRVRRTAGKDGRPLPAKYDTVFHSTVRGGLCVLMGKALWGRPREVSLRQMEDNDFEVRDFLVYMSFHALAATSSVYISGYLCYHYEAAHAGLLAMLIVITVHRGAKRYTYYSTSMYGRMIRKEFAEFVAELGQESKKGK